MFKNIKQPKINALEDVNNLLLQLSEEQLRALNRKIVERLKLINRAHSVVEVAKFNLGDRVFFKHHGKIIMGTITRLNQRTVSIITDEQHQWNVAPDFLNKIVE